ncbi:uncharacterized protein LOC111062039 isoform X2 [Nilaparvata lugens]|uniref:uncharacterized protein LOC111062039 isoform X2 n=1 Tax=Nilaparvata lugens TaxID=108931 RepID=UPI00193E9D8B|nr:uncharacterized protein LOC111062039 isoform X2 [Nilaparvata lugens]
MLAFFSDKPAETLKTSLECLEKRSQLLEKIFADMPTHRNLNTYESSDIVDGVEAVSAVINETVAEKERELSPDLCSYRSHRRKSRKLSRMETKMEDHDALVIEPVLSQETPEVFSCAVINETVDERKRDLSSYRPHRRKSNKPKKIETKKENHSVPVIETVLSQETSDVTPEVLFPASRSQETPQNTTSVIASTKPEIVGDSRSSSTVSALRLVRRKPKTMDTITEQLNVSNTNQITVPTKDASSDSSSATSSHVKTRRRKVDENCNLTKFGKVVNRLNSQQCIWQHMMRSADLELETSDWPVFIVQEIVKKFNKPFIKCYTEDDKKAYFPFDFSVPNSLNVLCKLDSSNPHKIVGARLKFHLPLMIIEQGHEIYLLGDERLELGQSKISKGKLLQEVEFSIQPPSDGFRGFPEDLLYGRRQSVEVVTNGFLGFEDVSKDIQYLELKRFEPSDEQFSEKKRIKIKDMTEFYQHLNLGQIRQSFILRFFVENYFVIGTFIGFALLPRAVCKHTRVYGEYLLVLEDCAEALCAVVLTYKEFTKLQLQRDGKDIKYKVSGFYFTHALPTRMLETDGFVIFDDQTKSMRSSAKFCYFLSPKKSTGLIIDEIN